MPFLSPGAAFGSEFDRFLMQKAQLEHQSLLDDLAQKRETRLAQAELDSAAERKQELKRRVAKDAEDAHEKKAKNLERRVSQMIAGDRPDPEMLQEAQSLGMAGIFRQQPPVMSTTPMQPPAALMEAPPAGAPVAGTATEEPAAVPGAMTPGPTVYPGSPKEREANDLKAKREAFVNSLPETMREDARLAFEAESLGLKTPTGLLGKGATPKTRLIFDPVKRQYTDATGKVITDVPENAVVDRAAEPKDHTATDAAREGRIQTTREHAYTEFNNRAKPVEDQISNLNKLTTSLNENSNIADSTLAEQIIKVTAGGANSGVRITLPEIEQVLKKSRTKWDDLQVALNKWSMASPEEKQSNLFYTPEQKQAMRDLVKAYRKKANETHQKILSYRRQIDDAADITAINRLRTRAEEDLFTDVPDNTEVKPKRTAAEILAAAGIK